MKREDRAAAMRDARFHAVLEAAVQEAEEKGFANIRQAAVALRAGVAKGSVLHAFGSMGALRDAVMSEAVARNCPRVIAEGLAVGHPIAQGAPKGLRQAAVQAIS